MVMLFLTIHPPWDYEFPFFFEPFALCLRVSKDPNWRGRALRSSPCPLTPRGLQCAFLSRAIALSTALLTDLLYLLELFLAGIFSPLCTLD